MEHITNKVLMVKPIQFGYNDETAVNNYYQKQDGNSAAEIQKKALAEFEAMVRSLEGEGIEVKVLEDTKDPYTPDSIFPNNWFSTHGDTLILYPMFAENRRLERREEVQQFFEEKNILNIIDYSPAEEEHLFLEGTGSLVLDRKGKKAYCSLSERADEKLLDIFCQDMQYQKVAFHSYQSVDGKRMPIYHTNVMMAMGEKFAILCADCIDDPMEREKVVRSLEESKKEIVFITEEQVEQFLGNAIELINDRGEHLCVLSKTAERALSPKQRAQIEQYAKLVAVDVSTIEKYGGGSARCMIAELFTK